ncbi:MAG TPA: tetratricopeptide repeat protein [Verrucomicrobiae bacterium]
MKTSNIEWGKRETSNVQRSTFNVQREGARTSTIWWLLLLGCLLGAPFTGLAGEAEGKFDAANKFYEQGKYAEAIAAYREMVKAGEASAAVYFNLGNAYYKAGRVGEAVASYRLAQRITPRDADLKANLRFVQESAGVRSGRPVSIWQAWCQQTSLREWAWITGGAVWVLAILGIIRMMKPAWRTGLKPAFVIALFTVVLGGVAGATAWQGTYGQKAAVVKVKEAVVRFGPLEDSQSAFTLPDGAEVVVTDQKDAWWQVRDGQGRTGWVKGEAVVRLEEL